MDVIGIHIIGRHQSWQAFIQTLHRQAIGSINTGCPENEELYAIALRPATQAALGIDPAARPGTFRIEPPGFVDNGPAAIAVNPRRTYVNEATW